jgi:hypothetical protein
MTFHPLLLAADIAPELGGFLPPGVLVLVLLALALVAVVLLLILVLIEKGRLAITRQQLKIQILTHLQASYPGAEVDLELVSDEPGTYKEMSPDSREAAKAYIDFCAERFHWWRAGLVDDAIWNGWDRSMSQQLKRPGVQMAWRERHMRELSYAQAFKDWVNRKMTG